MWGERDHSLLLGTSAWQKGPRDTPETSQGKHSHQGWIMIPLGGRGVSSVRIRKLGWKSSSWLYMKLLKGSWLNILFARTHPSFTRALSVSLFFKKFSQVILSLLSSLIHRAGFGILMFIIQEPCKSVLCSSKASDTRNFPRPRDILHSPEGLPD